VPLFDPENPGEGFVPDVAADLDGDGTPELITPRLLLRRQGEQYHPEQEIAVPDFDCGC
jgi:hypothetical protein